jgi:hypothetical protein
MPIKIIDTYKTNRLSDLVHHAADLAENVTVAEIADGIPELEDVPQEAVGCPAYAERGCALDGVCINQLDGGLVADCDEMAGVE